MGYNAILREKRVIRPNYGNSKAGFRPYGAGSRVDGAGSIIQIGLSKSDYPKRIIIFPFSFCKKQLTFLYKSPRHHRFLLASGYRRVLEVTRI